ncbi:subtilisin family serine protease [Kibdelosporangium banguiense]|uniref:Subtilisin family serine protease n=1 Tax=Kibdelosporangium banguiense TaxID=1365924 RepID=A0ABS4TEB4_9PSEU|nr:S8 family serine peptidase [Kibdelosporangium banguiense]MBP2322750.1 subtilisin family serine protease [Kibdelosporangium banguiense]
MGRKQCAVLTAALFVTGLAVTPAGAAEPTPTAAAGELGTVTLITGDRVTVRGERVAGVRMAEGRKHIRYWQYQLNGHDYVVPDDAVSRLTENKLDKRLFDVTGLVQQGYDDEHEPNVPTIVTGGVSRLASNLQAVDIPKAEAAKTWSAPNRVAGEQKIWLNGRVRATLDQSVKQIGAPQAWHQGFRADGVKVAVLDTGYDANHPDLKSKVDAVMDFTGEGDRDTVGHGTHVASTIAGTGAASGGKYAGVAPGARLLVGKVLGEFGGQEDWIINGMRWAVENGAKVVNMSLGGSPTDGTDLMSQVVNELSESSGALFVIAAGNSGSPETVGSPGSADRALTVANVTKSDELSVSSSQGPRVGDYGLKPEIAAPGTDIVAARAAGTLTEQSINEQYTRISGTSMATPHVAGAAAILAGQHPAWTGEQIKNTLIGSAKRLPGISSFAQGSGRLDIARGVSQQVRAEGVLGFGNLWGKQDAGRKISYVNDGPTPVQLTLSLDGVPANLFATDKTVTVPAKSSATVTVTARAGAKPAGAQSGLLRAQAGDVVLNTPVTANFLGDKNTLTVNVPSREGDPLQSLVIVQNEETGVSDGMITRTGAATFELPAGRYRALGRIVDPSFASTLFALPVQVSGNTAVTVDTKQGKKITVGIDDPEARPGAGGGVGVLSDVDEDGPKRGAAVLSGGGPPENMYAVGGHQMRGLSLETTTYWTHPWAVVNVDGPGGFEFGSNSTYVPYDLDFQGKLTARVVDVGEADAETINKAGDLTGAIALIRPNDWATPNYPPKGQVFSGIELLKAKGARAVVSFFLPTHELEGSPPPALSTIMAYNPSDVEAVQNLLKQRPVELTLTGRPNSPIAYFVAGSVKGTLPTGHDFRFRKDGLGRFDRQFNDTLPKGTYRYQPAVIDTGGMIANADVETKWPQQRIDYVSPNAALMLYSAAGFTDQADFGGETTPPVLLKPGERRATHMFKAPFGPELTTTPSSRQDGKPLPWAYRQGDRINLSIPMFADSDPATASMFDRTNLGSTVLLKDGKEIGRRDDRPALGMFPIPRGPGKYTLIADANRPQSETMAPPLSTRTRAEWTFTTWGGNNDRTALPLLDVRFDLPLDAHNTAVAGKPLSGKVTAVHQPGSRQSRIRDVSVEISFDEGKTWQRVQVQGDRLDLPAGGPDFASLRATARDFDGNTVTETITRAYAIK